MSHPPYSTEIRKTGFVLENEIAQTLKQFGWTVISNKYYLDDSEETVREIDLLAYRVTAVQHLSVYTTLLVSCKKSEDNAWALLARPINLKDPNSDWWPLHAWSNDRALMYQLSRADRSHDYHDGVLRDGVTEALALPAVEVFAFQEMDKISAKPKNDKPIFSAITSLMKAQAYELAALPARKKAPSVYQFNLLSVVDTDLIRLMFEGRSITQSPLDTEHYLARYIIRKREVFARIRFLRAGSFASALGDYDRLHNANCNWFESEIQAFYAGILEDSARVEVLAADFFKLFKWPVSWRLQNWFKRDFELAPPSIWWDKETSMLSVGFDQTDEVIEYMDRDADIKARIADALKKIYRYDGPFSVCFEVPF